MNEFEFREPVQRSAPTQAATANSLRPFLLGTAIGLAVGIIIGSIAGFILARPSGGQQTNAAGTLDTPTKGTGAPSGGSSGGRSTRSPTEGMTVDEFRKATLGQVYLPRKKFYDKFGEPLRILDVGGDTHLYYKCKDGDAVLKCEKGNFQYADTIAVSGIDRR